MNNSTESPTSQIDWAELQQLQISFSPLYQSGPSRKQMVPDEDVGRGVGNQEEVWDPGTTGSSIWSWGRNSYRSSAQEGQPDRHLWPFLKRCNHPWQKLGDLYLTHHPSPVSCWGILTAESNQKPEGKRPFWCSSYQSHTEEEKAHLERKNKGGGIFSTVMWIAQIYPELRQSWRVLFRDFCSWVATYTNKFLDEILITSTSPIFAATLTKHLFLTIFYPLGNLGPQGREYLTKSNLKQSHLLHF